MTLINTYDISWVSSPVFGDFTIVSSLDSSGVFSTVSLTGGTGGFNTVSSFGGTGGFTTSSSSVGKPILKLTS